MKFCNSLPQINPHRNYTYRAKSSPSNDGNVLDAIIVYCPGGF